MINAFVNLVVMDAHALRFLFDDLFIPIFLKASETGYMFEKIRPWACHNARPMRRGFTLVELLVVISIATILAVAAAPALQSLPANARLQERVQKLSSQLQTARSEAIRSNRMLYVCALKAKSNLQVQGCSATQPAANVYDWNQGVLVYADDVLSSGKSIGQYDTGESISHTLFDQKVNVRAAVNQIAFMPSGRPRNGKPVTFTLRDQITGACRTVLMDASGRARSCKSAEEACDAC